jgi:hypothetical protein
MMTLKLADPKAPPAPAHERATSRLLWLVALYVLLLVLVHMARSDLPFARHVLSEYALGRAGALATLSFFVLAAVFGHLALALRPWVTDVLGWLGMAALGAAALGAAMAGLFPLDPAAPAGTGARLHGAAFVIGAPGALAAMTFLNLMLAQRPSWRHDWHWLAFTLIFAWAATLGFGNAMSQAATGAAPAAMGVGLWNKLLLASWLGWAVVLATRSVTLRRMQARAVAPSLLRSA